jgi:hypothetical protein
MFDELAGDHRIERAAYIKILGITKMDRISKRTQRGYGFTGSIYAKRLREDRRDGTMNPAAMPWPRIVA